MELTELYEIFKKYPQVQTDSRKVQKGDLYFALKGERFNGNSFVQQALDNGAAYCIVDEEAAVRNEQCILVKDVLTTLQALALEHRRQFQIPIIAITGSNGKTTTKELILQVLSAKYKTYATEGNLNNHIGVPLTLLKIKPDAEMALIEMGANHQNEIAFYCTIAEPTFGLITNVGKAHLEGFGGLEGVRRAKGELFDYIRDSDGYVFINKDLPYLSEMAEGIVKQVSYGTSNAEVIAKPIEGKDGMLKFAVLSSGMEASIQTQLVGDYNLPNALAAITIGNFFDLNIDEIKLALESYVPSNSRSQLLQKGTNTLILDAYNANPSSMKLAVENLSRTETEKTKWLFLGAMKEMGSESKAEHCALVALAENLGFQHVVLVGKEFDGVETSFQRYETSEQVLEWLKENPLTDSYVLIKGSRGSKMEVVLPGFE